MQTEMSIYKGLDFEKYENCFVKTEDVNSVLLYGNIEAINSPWFTVFIPTYGRADLLKEALESVLHQYPVDFLWDIVVVDNDAYNGEPNETEKLIRKLDSKRILYYRNSKTLRPGDNFNRGILLARGKWVMMLHDDDLLVSNAIWSMGELIRRYEKKPGRPLGAISAYYCQYTYDPKTKRTDVDIAAANAYFSGLPLNYGLCYLTHSNVIFTAHIGGYIPSNGTTYNREAVLQTGGFNDDLGIMADLVLFYQMENKYSVYSTIVPFGFYRWGDNSMIKPESTYNVVKMGYDFREYVYSKNLLTRIWGATFRKCHYFRFVSDVINLKKNFEKHRIQLDDFDSIYDKRPSKFSYFLYINFVFRPYHSFKRWQTKRLSKR